MGVRVTGVEREVDNYYLHAELRRTSSDEARDSIRASILDQVQSMFGEVGGSNSSQPIWMPSPPSSNRSPTPPSRAANAIIGMSAAKALTDRLNSNAAQFGQVRADTDSKIGESASELEDKRDIAIANLSTEIDVETVSGSNGRIAILADYRA